MINVNEFASNKMKELRNKKGISQEELAECMLLHTLKERLIA